MNGKLLALRVGLAGAGTVGLYLFAVGFTSWTASVQNTWGMTPVTSGSAYFAYGIGLYLASRLWVAALSER